MILVLAVVVLATLQFNRNWSDGRFSQDRFLFADVASAYNLALDIAADPLAWLNWDLPSANYLIPEQLLLLPQAVAGLTLDEAVPWYLGGYLLWLGLAVYALARCWLRQGDSAVAAAVTVSVAAMMPSVSAFPGAHIATANFHAGIVLFAPLVLAGAVRVLRDRSRGWAVVLVVALALICFSDRLAIVQISVPLLLALGLATVMVWVRGVGVRGFFAVAGLIVLGTGLGMVIDMTWRPDVEGASPMMALDRFVANSKEIWHLSVDMRWTFPVLYHAIWLTPGFALVGLIGGRTRLSAASTMVLAYVLFYLPVIQLVHAGSTMAPVPYYRMLDMFLPLMLFPIMFLACPIGRLWRRALRAGALVLIAVSLWAVVPMWAGRNNGDFRIIAYVACLDDLARRHDLHYGAAEYFNAVPVQALSHTGLLVISVGPDLRPRRWNQTRNIDPGRPFDFLVLDEGQVKKAAAEQFNPVEYAICDGKTVAILPKP